MGENVLKFGTYVRVGNAAEAYELLQKNRNNKIVGGGIWMRLGSRRVATAIDLSACGLDQIEETETEFRIGAMCTLRQLERHVELNALVNNVFEFAVHDIVGVQLRNLATVGGSIYSRFGFSDVLTMFLAMDCDVELYKGGILPLQEYAQRPYDRDVLVRLIVKKTPMQLYYQSVRNSQTDIPVLTCAAARLETGDYRIAIGARPLRAVRFELPAEPALAAEQLAAQFAESIKPQIVTGSNMRGSAEYRRPFLLSSGMIPFVDTQNMEQVPATSTACPGSILPLPIMDCIVSPAPPQIGIPAGSPVFCAISSVKCPIISHGFTIRGIISSGIPRMSSCSFDQHFSSTL